MKIGLQQSMIGWFYSFFAYLYSFFFESNEIKETEYDYVARQLNAWKVDLFSENSYLTYIPHKQIYNKQVQLKKKYWETQHS